MNSKKNLAICIPSGRFVDFSFFKSFAQTIAPLMISYNTAVFTVASQLIFENRNEILRRAFKLEEKTPGFKFDFLLWIDNDIVFTFEQVKKLLSHLEEGDKEFVSGTYYSMVNDEIKPVAYFKNGERFKWLEEKGLKKEGLMEVDAAGFGFCAMKTDLARKVSEKFNPRPFGMRFLSDGCVITEDQVFCERAKELGAKIWLCPPIVFRHPNGFLPG